MVKYFYNSIKCILILCIQLFGSYLHSQDLDKIQHYKTELTLNQKIDSLRLEYNQIYPDFLGQKDSLEKELHSLEDKNSTEAILIRKELIDILHLENKFWNAVLEIHKSSEFKKED